MKSKLYWIKKLNTEFTEYPSLEQKDRDKYIFNKESVPKLYLRQTLFAVRL